jgi:hypothetical protein
MLTVSFAGWSHGGRNRSISEHARIRHQTRKWPIRALDTRRQPRPQPKPFDYAVMTGNVAQHIGESGDWERTLTDIREATVPSAMAGCLAFENRNHEARA